MQFEQILNTLSGFELYEFNCITNFMKKEPKSFPPQTPKTNEQPRKGKHSIGLMFLSAHGENI